MSCERGGTERCVMNWRMQDSLRPTSEWVTNKSGEQELGFTLEVRDIPTRAVKIYRFEPEEKVIEFAAVGAGLPTSTAAAD